MQQLERGLGLGAIVEGPAQDCPELPVQTENLTVKLFIVLQKQLVVGIEAIVGPVAKDPVKLLELFKYFLDMFCEHLPPESSNLNFFQFLELLGSAEEL